MIRALGREFTVLQSSSYPRRALAALLDGVIGYMVLFVTYVAAVWNVRPGPQDTWVTPSAPAWLGPTVLVTLAVYLTLTTWRGATVGMRALDLRVVRVDGTGRLGPGRSAVRGVALLAVLTALFAVHPLLVPVYGLVMFLIPRRRLPHDLLVGSVVVRATPGAPDDVAPQVPSSSSLRSGALDPAQARSALEDLGRVADRVRDDLRLAAVPVLVLGLIALGGALVSLLGDQSPLGERLSTLSLAYWAAAAPAGLVAALVWSRQLQRRTGVRPDPGWLVAIAVVAAAAAVAALIIPFGPVLVGLAFLVLAVHERSLLVAVCAVGFTVVVGVEHAVRFVSFSLFSNRIPGTGVADFMTRYGASVVGVTVGIVLLTVGTLAYRHRATR
jgi:uncharacterized RDD family membrane protein YckC